MKSVKNSLNYEPPQGKIFTQKSKTIPDQTMSLRTILERYSRGLPITGEKQSIFEGDEPSPDLRLLDLTEIQELKETTLGKINSLKTTLEEQKQAKAKAKAKATLLKELADEEQARTKQGGEE